MSRTDACGISKSCTPTPPTYPYEPNEPTEAPNESTARDRVARPSAARARLTRLSGATQKYEGRQRMSPSPALERDPAVQHYRWHPEENRYQVTRYDPERVRFTHDGRPLSGPTVRLDNRPTRLDDAIDIVRGRAAARLKAVQTLEETPLGTRAILSSRQCQPVYTHILAAIQHAARAEELLKAGKGAAAKRALARASRAYNDAAIELNRAKRQISDNVELTVGVLTAIKAAGEVAEIGLIVAGGGAVGKGVQGLAKAAGAPDWVATAAKIAGSTALKSGYAAFDQVREQLVLGPDTPVDWSKVGKEASKAALWSLVSGTVSNRLEGLMMAAGTGEVRRAVLHVGRKVATNLLRAALEQRSRAARTGEKVSPRRLADRAMNDTEATLRKTLTDEGYDVTKGTGKAMFQALVSATLEQRGS